MKTPTIPQEVYDALPTTLKDACLQFTDLHERDSFFLATMSIIGSAMSQYSGSYKGQEIFPTLQLFTVYHQPLQTLQPLQAATLLAYNLEKGHMRAYRMEQMEMQAAGEKANPVNWQKLIPVDSSYFHIVNTIEDKGGLGLLYNIEDKELPLLAAEEDKVRLLYNSFYNHRLLHHSVAGNENICIDNLQLSVWLSGSYEQLQQVVPNKEHCLFNNFCYNIIEGKEVTTDNPFEEGIDIEAVVSALTNDIDEMFYQLVYGNNTRFIVKEAEQQLFIESTNGYTRQQRMVCYRIAMILTMLQYYYHFKTLDKHKEIDCTASAMQMAIYISEVLNEHYKLAEEYLTRNGIDITPVLDKKQLTEEELLVANMHREGISLRKIAVRMYDDEGKFMKVKRMLARMGIAA